VGYGVVQFGREVSYPTNLRKKEFILVRVMVTNRLSFYGI
jgi:hypothetical protein